MITIFNRKELTITHSMERQAQIRDLLADHKIDYKMKVVNRDSPSPLRGRRARTGTFGHNITITYEYIFYVHKDNYKMAQAVIAGNYKR